MANGLTTVDFINGLFSFLVITVGAIIGLLIAVKYFKFKRKLYLYWGITYIGFYSPWWSSAFSFILVLFTGKPLPLQQYITISIILAPFFLVIWLIGFTEMIYEEKRKLIILIFSIILAAFHSYVIYYLIVDPSVLGEKEGLFDIKYSLLILIYFMFINITVTITGIIFAKQTFKSDNNEIRFKGKVLLIAFLTYPICGIFDAGVDLNTIELIIIRSLLIFGAIMFYIGFFVPTIIKKIFKLE